MFGSKLTHLGNAEDNTLLKLNNFIHFSYFVKGFHDRKVFFLKIFLHITDDFSHLQFAEYGMDKT